MQLKVLCGEPSELNGTYMFHTVECRTLIMKLNLSSYRNRNLVGEEGAFFIGGRGGGTIFVGGVRGGNHGGNFFSGVGGCCGVWTPIFTSVVTATVQCTTVLLTVLSETTGNITLYLLRLKCFHGKVRASIWVGKGFKDFFICLTDFYRDLALEKGG